MIRLYLSKLGIYSTMSITFLIKHISTLISKWLPLFIGFQEFPPMTTLGMAKERGRLVFSLLPRQARLAQAIPEFPLSLCSFSQRHH